MEKLLSHMRHRMIRPLEMLREFDKSGTGHLSQKDFAMRLKVRSVPVYTSSTRLSVRVYR